MKVTKSLIFVFFFLTALLIALLYKNSLSAAFFQDDWFTLTISQGNSINNILSFFQPRTEIIYYRPIGMQIPFFLLQTMFGLNPFPYHLTTYTTILLASFLTYELVLKVTKRQIASLLAFFLFASSSIHIIPMYWTSTYAFVLGACFFLASFLSYIQGEERKNNAMKYGAIVLYILGICTNELVITLPGILLGYELFLGKRKLKELIPYVAIALIYVVLRFVFFAPSTEGVYTISFGKEATNNLKAYVLWSVNLPEEIKAQFVSTLKINPEFIKNFKDDVTIFATTMAINISIFLIAFAVSLIKRKKETAKILGFGATWFFIGLTPVLFFPKHSFTYYLEISLVGMLIPLCFCIDELVKNLKNKAPIIAYGFLCIVLLNWVIGSNATIIFNEKVHWAPQRSKLSNKLQSEIKRIYPIKPANKTVYVYDTDENKLSLNNQDAVKILFNDNTMEVVYVTAGKDNTLLVR